MTRVGFLGQGLHTALGGTVAECVAALRRPPPVPALLASPIDPHLEQLPYFLLKGIRPEDTVARYEEVLYRVIREALDNAGLSSRELGSAALLVGSSSFEIAREEHRYRDALERGDATYALAESGMGNLSENIRQRLGLSGPDFTFNTACTSSANALWYGHKLIRDGLVEHVLVLGIEFQNDTTAHGFQSLQLLSPSQRMRPFDARRDGLVLGESCAAMVLGRSDEPVFALHGAANLCDTYSISTTREDGAVVTAVLQEALQNAGLRASDIDAIKCHGTATHTGDAAEARGTREIFDPLPPSVTLKPFLGHTLGACGLTELILFCAAARAGFLPGAPADSDLDFALNQNECELKPGFSMLNYFGFGGNNTSLIVGNGGGHRED